MFHEGLYVDHIFMLSATGGECEIEALRQAGFTESSRRSHIGLGTANAFFCFDNVFLEILWITDPQVASQSPLAAQLARRLDALDSGACPFGVGFRTQDTNEEMPFATWEYIPPDTAKLNSVKIAACSKDLCQPLLFRAQRSRRPDDWTDGRAGERQRPGGMQEISSFDLRLSRGCVPCADLERLSRRGLFRLIPPADSADIVLRISLVDGGLRAPVSLRGLAS